MRFQYLAFTVIALFLADKLLGQNLVPNADFETYNNCPSNLISIPFSSNYNNFPTATDWTNPAKQSSPDYLNACAITTSGLKIPYSSFGYQQPVSGNAYAGIIAFQGLYNNGNLVNDYREYLQNKLTHPLTAGKQYCISFYVSPTISSFFNFNYIALDEMGINLSSQRTIDTQNQTLTLPYAAKNPTGNFLTDTAKWYKIQANYTATGGEEWLTLGCFKNNNAAPSFINVYPLVPNPNQLYWSYLFIDDVSVIEITSADTIKSVALDTVVCKSSGLNIPLTSTAVSNNYSWNNGATSINLVANDTGLYWCTAKLDCGLQIDTFHIRYQPYRKLDIGKDTFNCMMQPMTIGANNYYSSYLWNTGAMTNAITVYQTGDYILTVSDTCGIQTDTIHIAIQPPTNPPLVNDTVVCQHSFSPIIPVAGQNIQWYLPNNNFPFSNQPQISTAQYGIQTLYVTQKIGYCESPKTPVNINVKYKPDADIGDYINICFGEDTVIGHSYPDVYYLWNTNEVNCCIHPQSTGNYQLTIFNSCGTSSDSIFVEISDCDDCIYLPTAFTPNNDGINDVFSPLTKCAITNYNIHIYNRWGETVFTSNDPDMGWDGKMLGVIVPMGVYVYQVEYRSVNTGKMKHIKGNVTLIR